jgi:hypothetical protein
MKKGALLFCISALLFSCGSNQPAEGRILSSVKMQDVMWDFLQADAYTEFYLKKDSSKNIFLQNAALQKKIFSLHQITKEDFYKSFDYYNNHSSDMRIILDSVSAKAERKRNKMLERKYSQHGPK